MCVCRRRCCRCRVCVTMCVKTKCVCHCATPRIQRATFSCVRLEPHNSFGTARSVTSNQPRQLVVLRLPGFSARKSNFDNVIRRAPRALVSLCFVSIVIDSVRILRVQLALLEFSYALFASASVPNNLWTRRLA